MNKPINLSKPENIKKNNSRPISVLGPVNDLEQHVNADWWRQIFNSLYLKTDGDVVEDSSITRKEVQTFIKALDISPKDHILDLCCGQGRHALEFSRRGFEHVYGLDRSRYLIQKARGINKKEELKVQFKEGDARKLPYPADSFEAVMILGNSFGYFESIQDDLAVLKEIFRTLKPFGKLLIDVANGEYMRDNFLSRTWEWIDKKRFVCRERSLSMDKQRLISREVVTHVNKGVMVDQFYAERLYDQKILTELLHKAGFENTSFHEEIITESQRNQDLGMMEKRILATATVKKKKSIAKKSIIDEKKVWVLLGDPRKPDPLKPLYQFDEDDFHTIDMLKFALGQLKNYAFSYIDNHDLFCHELQKNKDRIDLVLNLCDEGFNNDPRSELHVPSLLDILKIPFTGSGAQCLAYCYDKSLVRGIAKEMGVPVPLAFLIKPDDSVYELPIEFPVIVKPNFGDSSFGINQESVAYSIEEISNAILRVREKEGYEKPILVEKFLAGKEVTVGIIGNPPESYTVLPIIEEDYSALPEHLPKICGYEAKWLPDSPYWNLKSLPAQLPADTEKLIIDSCLKLFERLECKDYCRFDWRLDENGEPKLLEVNPNPGWCWDGHLAKMTKVAKMSYSQMLEGILSAAEQRLIIKNRRL